MAGDSNTERQQHQKNTDASEKLSAQVQELSSQPSLKKAAEAVANGHVPAYDHTEPDPLTGSRLRYTNDGHANALLTPTDNWGNYVEVYRNSADPSGNYMVERQKQSDGSIQYDYFNYADKGNNTVEKTTDRGSVTVHPDRSRSIRTGKTADGSCQLTEVDGQNKVTSFKIVPGDQPGNATGNGNGRLNTAKGEAGSGLASHPVRPGKDDKPPQADAAPKPDAGTGVKAEAAADGKVETKPVAKADTSAEAVKKLATSSGPELPPNSIIPDRKYASTDFDGLRHYNVNASNQITECVTRTNYANGDYDDTYYDAQRPEGNVTIRRRLQPDQAIKFSSVGPGNIDRGGIFLKADGTSTVRTVQDANHTQFTLFDKNQKVTGKIDVSTDALGNRTEAFSDGQHRLVCRDGSKYERAIKADKSVEDTFYSSVSKEVYKKNFAKDTAGAPAVLASTDGQGTNQFRYLDGSSVSFYKSGVVNTTTAPDAKTGIFQAENIGPKPEDCWKAKVVPQGDNGYLWEYENGGLVSTNRDSSEGCMVTPANAAGQYEVKSWGKTTEDNYTETHLPNGEIITQQAVPAPSFDQLLSVLEPNEWEFVRLVNARRAELGRSQLLVDTSMQGDPENNNAWMDYHGYSGHFTSASVVPGMGEIAYHSMYTPQDAYNGFMNSPHHRQILEREDFTTIYVAQNGANYTARFGGGNPSYGLVTYGPVWRR